MALKKKRAAKWQVWNKGLEVGQKDAFTPAQVNRIRHILADRWVPDFSATFTTTAFDDSSLRWLEIST